MCNIFILFSISLCCSSAKSPQIYLAKFGDYSNYESIKSEAPPSYCRQLWQFFGGFLKNEEVYDKIFFSAKKFWQFNGEILPPK